MATQKAVLSFYLVLLIAAAFSSFIIVHADDSSKSEEHTDKDASVRDDSSQEDSKEKRSREEIMFGNQQNKPNGLVDDLMDMTDSSDDEDNIPDKKSSGSTDEQKSEEAGKDEDKRSPHSEGDNDMMMESGNGNWYNAVPVSSSALQYLPNPPTLQSLPSEDFTNSLYDQEDLYRRKRQLLEHRIPLRKRSLRSSLGQMIQKRGIRIPRRSMRLKRQVDMGDLLSLFGNDRYYEDQSTVTPPSSDGWEASANKRHVPGRFGGYPETPVPEFRYPVTFRHRDGGILSSANDFEDNNEEMMDGDRMEDIDSLMLLPPTSQYIDAPEVDNIMPYRTRENENEAIQKWLSRHTTPNVFSVSRRSAPIFYPLDYRYIPGYRKRSIFGSRGNRFGMEEVDEQEPDLGKWGRVVQVPEAYAAPEDVARLYGLANLMAEGEENDSKKKRRST